MIKMPLYIWKENLSWGKHLFLGEPNPPVVVETQWNVFCGFDNEEEQELFAEVWEEKYAAAHFGTSLFGTKTAEIVPEKVMTEEVAKSKRHRESDLLCIKQEQAAAFKAAREYAEKFYVGRTAMFR